MMQHTRYGGFWIRLLASLIDTIWVTITILLVLYIIYGRDYFTSDQAIFGVADIIMNYLFPVLTVILFWKYRSATPGKMLLSLEIVDATSHGKPTIGQFIIRYVGYFVSTIALCLGFIWIAFDKRKQGWHDKMANTVVIRKSGKCQTQKS